MDILKLLNTAGGTISLGVGLMVVVGVLLRLLVVERRDRGVDRTAYLAERAEWAKSRKEERDADTLRWQTERAADTARWQAEISRINADHDQEIREMRAKINNLESSVQLLNERVDMERELRRKAQDGVT